LPSLRAAAASALSGACADAGSQAQTPTHCSKAIATANLVRDLIGVPPAGDVDFERSAVAGMVRPRARKGNRPRSLVARDLRIIRSRNIVGFIASCDRTNAQNEIVIQSEAISF
jgi:hypothetical protein